MEEQQQQVSRFGRVMNIALIVLVLVAVVLGYFLYQKQREGTEVLNPDANADMQNAPQAETVDGMSDEQIALNPPARGASDEALRAHFESVQRIAVASDTITIGTNCTIAPAVLKVLPDAQVTFENEDTTAHTISFSPEFSFMVPAGQSTTTVVNTDGAQEGLHGFGCDQSPTASGMVWVSLGN